VSLRDRDKNMSDWLKEDSTEKLRQIAASQGDASGIGRAANQEIRRREVEEAKKDAERSSQAEAQRHQEVLALKKETAKNEESRFQIQLDEARRQGAATRRIAYFAVGVSVISVLVGIWLHFHPIGFVPVSNSNPPAIPPIQ
jgi:hypothetical protein